MCELKVFVCGGLGAGTVGQAIRGVEPGVSGNTVQLGAVALPEPEMAGPGGRLD